MVTALQAPPFYSLCCSIGFCPDMLTLVFLVFLTYCLFMCTWNSLSEVTLYILPPENNRQKAARKVADLNHFDS